MADLDRAVQADKDAVLIARLAGQLRCYVPEPIDPTWGRLRHLGARRDEVIGESPEIATHGTRRTHRAAA